MHRLNLNFNVLLFTHKSANFVHHILIIVFTAEHIYMTSSVGNEFQEFIDVHSDEAIQFKATCVKIAYNVQTS